MINTLKDLIHMVTGSSHYWKIIEVVYPTYVEYQVHGEYLSDKKWDELYESFEKCFGKHLMEVYSYQSNGLNFAIFIGKNFLREQKLKRLLYELS